MAGPWFVQDEVAALSATLGGRGTVVAQWWFSGGVVGGQQFGGPKLEAALEVVMSREWPCKEEKNDVRTRPGGDLGL